MKGISGNTYLEKPLFNYKNLMHIFIMGYIKFHFAFSKKNISLPFVKKVGGVLQINYFQNSC